MKTSMKLFVSSLMLCLALTLTVITAGGTIQAYQEFQQNHQSVQHGDVTTVKAWMTIPYVAHVYRVPQPCFTQTLHLNDRWLVQHATLRVLADHYQRPIGRMLQDVENVILGYRRKQLKCEGPPFQPIQVHRIFPSPSLDRKGQV